jgi:hypothetical protein
LVLEDSLVRPDLLLAGEKLLESRIVSNRIPHWIDLQLLNRNVKTYRERKEQSQRFYCFARFA